MPLHQAPQNAVELLRPDPGDVNRCFIIIHADDHNGCLVQGDRLNIEWTVEDTLATRQLWEFLIDCDQSDHRGPVDITLNDEYLTLSYEIWAGLFLALTRFSLLKELGFLPDAGR